MTKAVDSPALEAPVKGPIPIPAPVALGRRLLAEGLGTAFLLATVVGSGIMAERLARGNDALALLVNSLATGASLVALTLAFGPVSGAHFNPAVTLALAWRRELAWKDVPVYVAVQAAGAVLGVWEAHYMFEAPILMASRHVRTGGPQWAGEVVATLGLSPSSSGAPRPGRRRFPSPWAATSRRRTGSRARPPSPTRP